MRGKTQLVASPQKTEYMILIATNSLGSGKIFASDPTTRCFLRGFNILVLENYPLLKVCWSYFMGL